MKKLFLFTLLVAALAAFGAVAAQAGIRVQICHIPPGNPVNFHTITVSESAPLAYPADTLIPRGVASNANTLTATLRASARRSEDACDRCTAPPS